MKKYEDAKMPLKIIVNEKKETNSYLGKLMLKTSLT